MKKHYIKHSLNNLEFLIKKQVGMKNIDIKRAVDLIKDIRKELDKDDDK
ncbi:hypothetical protein [Bacillus phage Sarmo]|nr:hypothetical protein [Bacillus phage Sarmo]